MKLSSSFIKYIFVGGSAFLVDTGVLLLCREFIFKEDTIFNATISVVIAFIVAFIFNYILSDKFVFDQSKSTKKTSTKLSLTLIIALFGLFLTAILMNFGEFTLHLNYLFVKVVVSAIVLFYNYFARKYLVFNDK